MLSTKSIVLAGAVALAQLTGAHPTIAPRSATNDTQPSPPGPILGSDEPSPLATTGYFLTHLSLNVKNLTASIDFYTSVLGFREIFSLPASEHLTVSYLGYAQGGRNGTGYQTSAELARDMSNLSGLIEMLCLDVPEQDLPASSEKANTFGHLGIVVPDIDATQTWLESRGVEFLKKVDSPTPRDGPIANANSFPPAAWAQLGDDEKEQIGATLDEINWRFIFIADPDGNIIEIQPQR
jgi:lactoylglutathione lyase